MSKKNITENILIEDIEFPNKGIGFLDDKKIFVKNTIPGQSIKVNLKKKKQKFEGRLLEIIQKAPYEIESDCNKFGICGGCTYRNISYEKELEFKEKNVLKLLTQLRNTKQS